MEWYKHKTGFITSSTAHRTLTMQKSIDKGLERNLSKLVETLACPKYPSNFGVPDNPQNPRHWGLKHESSARQSYLRVERKRHHKLRLVSKGLLLSEKSPIIAASVDNIRLCSCATNCRSIVVEYKCPMKHQDITPKEAFLSSEIGGTKVGKKFLLKHTCHYYTQVQLQMYVTKLWSCDFVVWTKLGIFSVNVPYDAFFIETCVKKLQCFWITYVFPFLLKKLSINVEIEGKLFLRLVQYKNVPLWLYNLELRLNKGSHASKLIKEIMEDIYIYIY